MLVNIGTKLLFPLHLLPPEFFSAVYDYAGKADLISKGYWNPK